MDTLADITTKGWILALFIRSDGERLLLGDGWFDFKDGLQHFQPDTFANDVVELQGTDGQLLAGQVRRSNAQPFDGYIGDATADQPTIEQRRRQFLQFFRKKMFYTVVYIFPNGTAIQRKRGYIVDAPTVPELWQKFPEYHVALNFEDIDYYEYAEDENGNEIFAHVVSLNIASIAEGGLIWDGYGAVSEGFSWGDPQNISTVKGLFAITDAADQSPIYTTKFNGNTAQDIHNGRNLIKMNDASGTNANVSYYVQHTPAINMTLVEGTTYTFSADVTIGGSVSQCSWSIGCGTTQYAHDIFQNPPAVNGSAHISYTFTPTATDLSYGTHFYLRFPRFSTTQTGVNYSIKNVMVEEGDVEHPFEPYVAGAIVPSTTVPVQVETVTGNQVVTITGKNLFDGEMELGYINGITGQNAVNNAYIRDANYIPVAEQTDYILSSPTYSGQYLIYEYKLDKTYNLSTNKGSADGKFTTDPNTRFVRFRPNMQNLSMDTKFQLELGSTATTYEAPQIRKYEVNLGRNIMRVDDSTRTSGSFTITIADGVVTGDGTASGTVAQNLTTDWVVLQPGTYTMSANNTATNSEARLKCTDKATNSDLAGTELLMSSANATKTFTITEQKQVKFYARFGASTYDNFSFKPQLDRGSSATPYTPYFTPIELCKIGTAQDYIWNDDGTWKIHKEVERVILDGSETWTATQMTNSWLYYTIVSGFKTTATSQLPNILSDYFTQSTANAQWTSALGSASVATNDGASPSTQLRITVGDSSNQLSAFKTWLGNNKPSFYHQLATPTDTAITEQALISQLNSLNSANAWGAQNNIILTPTVGAQGELDMTYYRELQGGGGLEWSAGDGGGPVTIDVAGIASAYPVWTITGPATDPTLTNVTTGQTITWNGTVPSGQTLVIDMGNQTATMAGANVFQYLSGDWIELREGSNVVSYIANDTTDPSRLEWNGVVG